MISSVIFGDTVEDLKNITAVSADELWKIGFDLDDMDCWMAVAINQELGKIILPEDEWSRPKFECTYYSNPTPDGYWLQSILDNWDLHCVGYRVVEYNGYWWFTLHHA